MEFDILKQSAAAAEPVSHTRPAETQAPAKAPRDSKALSSLYASAYDSVSVASYEDYGGAADSQKTSEQPEQHKGTMELLDKAISDANKKLAGFDREFEYSVHEVTKDIMIKIIDIETQETVKEIPPKKLLDAVAKMWELAGIIIDERQ